MSEPLFADVKSQLTLWWNSCKITRNKTQVDEVAKRLYSRKSQFYDPLSKKTGVPWYMIAVIDERESGASGGVLHNGEKIIGTGKKTRLVPAGRGPFTTFEEAGEDALHLLKYDQVGKDKWSIELVLFCLEGFNGWGYRMYHSETPSPYVWSSTNIYDNSPRGKYVQDGKWQEGVMDAQIGCAPLLKALLALDKGSKPLTSTVATTVVVASGAAVATQTSSHWFGWVIGATLLLAGLTFMIIEIYRNRKKGTDASVSIN